MQTWLSVSEWLSEEWWKLLTAVMSAIVVFYKYTIGPIIRWFIKQYKLAKEIDTLIPLIKSNAKQLEKIVYELTPNGGNSVKDSINRVEANLTKIDNKMTGVLYHLGEPYFEMELDGQCSWVNISFMDLVGLSVSECLGHSWLQIIHPEDRDLFYEAWAEARKKGTGLTLTCKLLKPDNTVLQVKIQISVIRDNKKDVLGFIGHIVAK